ncbi:ABC transporter permease [Jatrophihabitans endophyticus]|uniref:ABC transporter permease n=1 Tax=Jatrophihabitans endophyticus TaxID=1206085 RepID=UPI0019F96996|nr:ABC transporter permease [Jatrophihabitans endophyticus]MBE7189082.1 ABC transporter permease [Jatrophihabitans endophyticus]
MPAGLLPLAAGPVIPTFNKPSKCLQDNGSFCWDYIKSNWSGVFVPALEQHIGMSLVAIAFGFVIAFVFAVLAHFFGFLVKPVTFIGSLLYTIPSIAAFEILAPITNINYRTVEYALISYTLLILFTNTLAGLSGVSPEVLDASRGLGMKRAQILLRVELPLALPTIVAGIRVATVTIISLTTIVAFVILPKGLGEPIQDGLNRQIPTEYVFGGILCIALALVADALLVLAQRSLTPWTRRRR